TPPSAQRAEVGGVPVVSYDSDTGLMLGGLLAVARFTPVSVLHAWRLEAALTASFKSGPGGLTLPLHDDLVSFDMPRLRRGAAVFFRGRRPLSPLHPALPRHFGQHPLATLG